MPADALQIVVPYKRHNEQARFEKTLESIQIVSDLLKEIKGNNDLSAKDKLTALYLLKLQMHRIMQAVKFSPHRGNVLKLLAEKEEMAPKRIIEELDNTIDEVTKKGNINKDGKREDAKVPRKATTILIAGGGPDGYFAAIEAMRTLDRNYQIRLVIGGDVDYPVRQDVVGFSYSIYRIHLLLDRQAGKIKCANDTVDTLIDRCVFLREHQEPSMKHICMLGLARVYAEAALSERLVVDHGVFSYDEVSAPKRGDRHGGFRVRGQSGQRIIGDVALVLNCMGSQSKYPGGAKRKPLDKLGDEAVLRQIERSYILTLNVTMSKKLYEQLYKLNELHRVIERLHPEKRNSAQSMKVQCRLCLTEKENLVLNQIIDKNYPEVVLDEAQKIVLKFQLYCQIVIASHDKLLDRVMGPRVCSQRDKFGSEYDDYRHLRINPEDVEWTSLSLPQAASKRDKPACSLHRRENVSTVPERTLTAQSIPHSKAVNINLGAAALPYHPPSDDRRLLGSLLMTRHVMEDIQKKGVQVRELSYKVQNQMQEAISDIQFHVRRYTVICRAEQLRNKFLKPRARRRRLFGAGL